MNSRGKHTLAAIMPGAITEKHGRAKVVRKSMKKADECNNIEEIRSCIDEIDKDIIANLTKRSSYVKSAAKFKKTVSDVRANDRVESMIKVRRDWAVENGINADFTESIFRNIVSYFIGNEITKWTENKVD
jgi:isochorismate pyruvate lyase